MRQASAVARQQFNRVVSELDSLLQRILQSNNNLAPLARQPYTTYLVYAFLSKPQSKSTCTQGCQCLTSSGSAQHAC